MAEGFGFESWQRKCSGRGSERQGGEIFWYMSLSTLSIDRESSLLVHGEPVLSLNRVVSLSTDRISHRRPYIVGNNGLARNIAEKC